MEQAERRGVRMIVPGEFDAGPFLRIVRWFDRLRELVRRNLLLIIFVALLVMQVLIWLKLDLIERSIPYGAYDGPNCDAYRPCHVIIDRP
jgi:hypothetical protein